MTHTIKAALALGLIAAAAASPALADCAGHVSAEAKGRTVVTADSEKTPIATDKKG